MNDVHSIFTGYGKVPTFGAALLAYWHAPWIQSDIYCFRPLSGAQYWLETYIGLHFGFIWNAWAAFILFSVAVWLIGVLSFRIFDSKLLAVFSAGLASAVRLYNTPQPDFWLIWYPVHQDILMLDFLFGALLFFDLWLEKRNISLLGASWILFLLGCMTKEYDYTFPFMAMILIVFRGVRFDRKSFISVMQPCLFAAVVGALLLVRRHLYLHPRDVHLNPNVICHKPLLFMMGPLGLNLDAANYVTVTFSSILAIVCFVLLRRANKRQKREENRGGAFSLWRIGKFFVVSGFAIGILSFILWLEGSDIVVFSMQFATNYSLCIAVSICAALAFVLVLVLIWSFTNEPIGLAWCWLFFCYFPTLSFIGWHYTFPGGMMRGIYWAAVIRILVLELNHDGFKQVRRAFGILGISRDLSE